LHRLFPNKSFKLLYTAH